MLKNPYRHITEGYPADRLPRELLGAIEAKGMVRIIVQRLDEKGEIVGGHRYLDAKPSDEVSSEDIVDYVHWVRDGI